MQMRSGCSWKQLIASMADSQSTISLPPRRAGPEVAEVLARPRRHPTPDARSRAAQLGADRPVGFSCHQEKDRIATLVGVQAPCLTRTLTIIQTCTSSSARKMLFPAGRRSASTTFQTGAKSDLQVTESQ